MSTRHCCHQVLGGVALLLLWSIQPVAAAPNCDVPNPPPICNDPPELQPPALSGGGYFNGLTFGLGVTPRPYGAQSTSVEVQRGDSENGPWRRWYSKSGPPDTAGVGSPAPYYSASESYVVAPTARCFRARVRMAIGGLTDWSTPKCASLSPVVTDLVLARRTNDTLVSWTDHSVSDIYDYVLYQDTSGRPQVALRLGTQGQTGRVEWTIPRKDAGRICAVVFEAESNTGNALDPDGPLNRMNNPSALTCAPGI